MAEGPGAFEQAGHKPDSSTIADSQADPDGHVPHKVYVFGRNNRGQLGVGHVDTVRRVTAHPFISSHAHQVRKVFCGYDHTFVLTAADEVWACGRNSKGQLGIGNTQDQKSPHKVEVLCCKGVRLMAGGLEFSLAVTQENEVYSWGTGGSGQLGLGSASLKETTPQRVNGLCGSGVRILACGRNHTLALTANDELFGFGDNVRGQLGLEGTPTVAAPVSIGRLCGKSIVEISCGYHFSMCMSRTGEAWAFGDNTHGQLGVGRNDEVQRTPWPVCILRNNKRQRVSHVSCGKEHAVLVTRSGDVYATGSNESGQLGVAGGGQDMWPRPIVALYGRGVSRVICGRSHTFAQTESGTTFVFGSNAYGEAGLNGSMGDDNEVKGEGTDGAPESMAKEEGDAAEQCLYAPVRVDSLSKPGIHMICKGSSILVGVDLTPNVVDEQHAAQARQIERLKRGLERDIGSLLESGSFADLCVCMHGQSDSLHRSVLGARCPSLLSDLDEYLEGQRAKQERTTKLQGVAPAAFEMLLQYVYRGEQGLHDRVVPVQTLLDLMCAARCYDLPRLQDWCEKRIEACTTVDTVGMVLRRASEVGAPGFRDRMLLSVMQQYEELVSSPVHALRLVEGLREQPQTLATILMMAKPHKDGERAEEWLKDHLKAGEGRPAFGSLSPSSSIVLTSGEDPVDEEDGEQEYVFDDDEGDRLDPDMLRLFDKVVLPSVQSLDKEGEESCTCDEKLVDARKMTTGGSEESVLTEETPCRRLPPGDFRVRLGVGGPCVLVHRPVLAARSGFFASMFREGGGGAMTESTRMECVLQLEPLPSMKSFLPFLRFLYTGFPGPITPAQALDILTLMREDSSDMGTNGVHAAGYGGFFQIKESRELSALCQDCIERTTDPTNVVALLCRAHCICDEEAKRWAQSFLLRSFRDCASSPGFDELERYPGLAVEVLRAVGLATVSDTSSSNSVENDVLGVAAM